MGSTGVGAARMLRGRRVVVKRKKRGYIFVEEGVMVQTRREEKGWIR